MANDFLNWIKKNSHSFTYRGRPARTVTWVAETPLRIYCVYRSVSQKFFFRHSGMTHDSEGMPGFYSGADEILPKKKIQVTSIEEGKKMAEEDYKTIMIKMIPKLLDHGRLILTAEKSCPHCQGKGWVDNPISGIEVYRVPCICITKQYEIRGVDQ